MFRTTPFFKGIHVVLFALLLLSTVPLLGQTATLQGLVVDSDHEPIQGVRITITADQLAKYRESHTSDKRGKFMVRFNTTQLQYQFTMLFEKSGYQSFKQPVNPSATNRMKETYVMDRAETQVVESLGDLGSVVSGSSNVAVDAFNEGLTAQKAGDFALAQTKYEEALAADEDLGPAHVALAQVHLDLRQYEVAIQRAEKALTLPINRADALQVKYQALAALGRDAESDAVLEELKTAEDAAASARLVYNEGGEAFNAKDHETALAKFEEAAALDPSLTDAHHAIATLKMAKGDYEAAAVSAEKALDLGSENVNTLRVLYEAYDALGRLDELTEIAPRLAAVDPEFGGAKLVEQAAQLWNSGQGDKAVALSRQALAIDAGLAKAYYFIGLDHLSNERNDEARSALEKFIAMAPDDSDALTAKEMLNYIP